MLHPLPLSAYHYNIKEGAKVVVINMKEKKKSRNDMGLIVRQLVQFVHGLLNVWSLG